jgi:hypothetical protein
MFRKFGVIFCFPRIAVTITFLLGKQMSLAEKQPQHIVCAQ